MTRIAEDARTYTVRLCRNTRLHDGDPCPLCDKPLGKYEEVEGDMGGPYLRLGKPRKTVEHRFVVATDYGEEWVSVSTVSKVLDKGGPLSGWAFNLTVDGVVRLLADGRDLSRMDAEMLKGALKQIGYTPWIKKDRAASRGNEVHETLERLARGDDPSEVASFIAGVSIDGFTDEETRDVQNYALAAAHWYLDNKPRVCLVEAPVWSAEMRVVGTLDLLAYRPDLYREVGAGRIPVVLTDLKTSKDVYVDHTVQVEGYRLCLDEMVRHGVLDAPLPDACSIVLARPDRTYDERIVPTDADAFRGALGLSRAVARVEAILKQQKKDAEEVSAVTPTGADSVGDQSLSARASSAQDDIAQTDREETA